MAPPFLRNRTNAFFVIKTIPTMGTIAAHSRYELKAVLPISSEFTLATALSMKPVRIDGYCVMYCGARRIAVIAAMRKNRMHNVV